MMRVTFRILDDKHRVKSERTCTISEQVSFASLLREQGCSVNYPCGGNGTCGKCKVRFQEGAPIPTTEEMRLLSAEEIEEGCRLACRTMVTSDCVIEIPESESRIQSVGIEQGERTKGRCGVAIDLGTTTIAYALVNLDSKEVMDTRIEENPQRRFGADVMSRMQQANSGALETLQSCVVETLTSTVKSLCKNFAEPERVVISGNTTMCHLLLGYSCERLAVAPFVPVSTEQQEFVIDGVTVTILPGISAFVGGDIVSGVCSLDFASDKQPKLLLDLGTNAEMVLWTGERFFATSASAGPALEGGNISCGCASVPGAICDVVIAGKKNQIKTIAGVPAVGICGSGLLAAMSGLMRNRLMDEDGILQEEFFEKGYPLSAPQSKVNVVITQEDIRNFQVAKSAIATGIECLLQQAQMDADTPMQVYLAGGLGVHMSVEAAVCVGLFPSVCKESCLAAGNTSLQGAIQYLCNPKQTKKRMEFMRSHVCVVSLNDWEKFQDCFVEHLKMSRH